MWSRLRLVREVLPSRLSGNVAFPSVGGWPLPAAGGQRRRCSDVRPNLLSAVDSESEAKMTREESASLRPRGDRNGTVASHRPILVSTTRKSSGFARDFRSDQ